MEIKKPLFIIGIGRSGSTIFFDVLSEHENAAWLSDILSKYPSKPQLNNKLLRFLDFPVFGNYIRKRFQPSECYNFWERYSKGFSTPFRDLTEKDVTRKSAKQIRNALGIIPTKNRYMLLLKLTGWPRVGFINNIFPDAKFIHVIRDGRAVANSMLNVDFWWGWRGPNNWRWGDLSDIYMKEWEKYNNSFVALAAIQWKLLMDSYDIAKNKIKSENYLEIKYEDFCSSTKKSMKLACDFAGLEFTTKFENKIKKYKIVDSNNKWQNDLEEHQQKILNEVLEQYLVKYKYL